MEPSERSPQPPKGPGPWMPEDVTEFLTDDELDLLADLDRKTEAEAGVAEPEDGGW